MAQQSRAIRSSIHQLVATIVGTAMLIVSPIASADLVADQGASGGWVSKQYQVNGDWTMAQRDGKWVIKFSDGFKTKSGPDLKVFLSQKSIGSVTGGTATQNAVMVSVLESSSGSQEYVLPASIDPTQFKSLLIVCEAYSVLWGGADFQ